MNLPFGRTRLWAPIMVHEKSGLEPIYKFFTMLTALGDVGGQLVFYRDLDAAGGALAAAANIAGAASLGVDADAECVKQALRPGICDFMVNHLDEALRILKNEIRKHQPVAVCLNANPENCAAEMIERGVQPDILVSTMAVFVERGARVLAEAPPRPDEQGVAWGIAEQPARWLPLLDGIANRVLDSADPTTVARRRWLHFAPRYAGRNLHHQRFLSMKAVESAQFLALVREASASGEIAAPVRITIGGVETLIG